MTPVGHHSDACKTAPNPHDLAVTAPLRRGTLLMPGTFLVSATATGNGVGPARHLVGELFGPIPTTELLSPEPLPHGGR